MEFNPVAKGRFIEAGSLDRIKFKQVGGEDPPILLFEDQQSRGGLAV